jgi:hypothetical protein
MKTVLNVWYAAYGGGDSSTLGSRGRTALVGTWLESVTPSAFPPFDVLTTIETGGG